MATAGMILGIVGIVLCWLPLVGVLSGLLGVIFGAIGMSKAGRLGGVGRGAGVTGLVTGILSLLLLPIMAAIAIPAFMEYMNKSKKTESSIHLDRLERRIKAYYIENAELPPSAAEMPGPAGAACDGPNHKFPVRPIADYMEDPGWKALDFYSPSRRTSRSSGRVRPRPRGRWRRSLTSIATWCRRRSATTSR